MCGCDSGDLSKFFENIKKFNVWNKITHIVGDYSYVSHILAPRQFDLIFIDGIHFKEYILRDLINTLSIIKIPGIIAFHDYNKEIEGRSKENCVNGIVDKLVNLLESELYLVDSLAVVNIPKMIRHPEYEL